MKKSLSIADAFKKKPLIFDGAMGTMIYQRGVFLNACYDELSLTQPKLILGIHQEYADAGADVLETNSFGANRIKLGPYGLSDKVADINKAAVRLARQAAGESIYVAASIGPCFGPHEALTAANRSLMEAALREQLEVLAAEKVDLIALETFLSIDQLLIAASLAHESGIPVLASFALSPDPRGDDRGVAETEAATRLEADANVDFIGMNCGRGPADFFHPIQHVMKQITKPLVVMPNAGGPSEVGGRMLYLNSPEYFTEFSKRYIELGVKGIGGCCGTTPAHIRMAARAIKTMSGVKDYIKLTNAPAQTPDGQVQKAVELVPFAKKSPLGAKLAVGKKVRLMEILPPQSAAGLPSFIEKCRTCEAAGFDAINLPDGPRATARISVMATAFAMQKAVGIEPIPHCCCRDRNLIGMQSDLLGGCALGLKTWLFITGDPPKLGNYPDATGVFDIDSIGLAQLANNLNHGFDAAGQAIGQATAMAIGVGANPVAVEMEREISRFYDKIDAGAEFAITQPVFEVDALLRYLERVRKHHKTIPVIAGIFPLISLKNAEFMNKHVPGVVVPDSILQRMSECKTKEEGLQAGVEIARSICARVADVVQGFQISAPLGRIDTALKILED